MMRARLNMPKETRVRFRKLDSAARTFPMAANQARIFSRNSKCNAPCMDTEPGVWSCPVSVIEKSAFPPPFFFVWLNRQTRDSKSQAGRKLKSRWPGRNWAPDCRSPSLGLAVGGCFKLMTAPDKTGFARTPPVPSGSSSAQLSPDSRDPSPNTRRQRI